MSFDKMNRKEFLHTTAALGAVALQQNISLTSPVADAVKAVIGATDYNALKFAFTTIRVNIEKIQPLAFSLFASPEISPDYSLLEKKRSRKLHTLPNGNNLADIILERPDDFVTLYRRKARETVFNPIAEVIIQAQQAARLLHQSGLNFERLCGLLKQYHALQGVLGLSSFMKKPGETPEEASQSLLRQRQQTMEHFGERMALSFEIHDMLKAAGFEDVVDDLIAFPPDSIHEVAEPYKNMNLLRASDEELFEYASAQSNTDLEEDIVIHLRESSVPPKRVAQVQEALKKLRPELNRAFREERMGAKERISMHYYFPNDDDNLRWLKMSGTERKKFADSLGRRYGDVEHVPTRTR